MSWRRATLHLTSSARTTSRPRCYMPAAPELKTLIGAHQVWATVFSSSCRILWPIWKAVNSTTSSSQLRTCSLVLARRNAICWLVVSGRNATGVFLYSSRSYNMVTRSLQPHNMYYEISVHTRVHVEVCAKFHKNPSMRSYNIVLTRFEVKVNLTLNLQM